MPDPDQTGTLISPAIDDELVVTVRLRVAAPDVLHRIEGPALISLPGRLHNAIKDLLDPGDVDLAGIEIATPTFRPYHTVYQRNSEPASEIG